ncbi:MAG: rhodanese-like domain-containing protein [Bacteroidales bacterium]
MKRLLIFCVFVVSGLARVNGQVQDSMKYVVLGAQEFSSGFKTKGSAVIIDSRDYKDYRKARIKGAAHIDWPIPETYFSSNSAPPKEAQVIIYCYVGNRSKKVCVVFYDHGYRNLYSLKGGFIGWRNQKMEVDRKKMARHKKYN